MTASQCPDCSWPCMLSSDVCAICGRYLPGVPRVATDPDNWQPNALPNSEENASRRHLPHYVALGALGLGWCLFPRVLFGCQLFLTMTYCLCVMFYQWQMLSHRIVQVRLPALAQSVGLFACATVVLMLWMGARWTGATSGRSLPAEYKILARHLCQGPEYIGSNSSGLSSPDQFSAVLRSHLLTLEGLHSQDRQILEVRDQATSHIREMLSRINTLRSLPSPLPADRVHAEMIMGSLISGVTGDPRGFQLGLDGAVDADFKQRAITQEHKALAVTLDSFVAVSDAMPIIAARYASPVIQNSTDFAVEMTLGDAGRGVSDTLTISNNGPFRKDCTLQVTLRGSNGEIRHIVVFVATWPSKSPVNVPCQQGREVAGQTFLRSTVRDLKSLDLRLWSPDYSAVANFTFNSPANR